MTVTTHQKFVAKRVATWVGIGAGLATIITAGVTLPDKISVAVAKGVRVELDTRYVQTEDYKEAHTKLEKDAKVAAEAAQAAATNYADGIKGAILDELRAYEFRTDGRLDKILMHTNYTYGVLRGATTPDYAPLPRKPQ